MTVELQRENINATKKIGLHKVWKKFLQIEQKIFSAPYNWLLKKGLIVVMEISEKVYLTMADLYDKRFFDEYKGNPNWAGDD